MIPSLEVLLSHSLRIDGIAQSDSLHHPDPLIE